MGAGPPVVSPGVNLPGAEYFALQPNRSIALGQRRAINVLTSFTSLPAGTTASVTQQLQILANWGYGDAIYIVRVYSLFVPGDASGELQILGARLGLGAPAGAIFIDLGIPLLTLLSPPQAQVAIYDRDALVTQLDTPSMAANQPLFLDSQLTVKNADATNAHSAALQSVIVFHEVKGIVQ